MKIIKVIEATMPTVKFLTDTNELREFNVTPLIRGEWYGKLSNPEYFALADVCDFGWAIGWPDGQAIAPDDLAESSVVQENLYDEIKDFIDEYEDVFEVLAKH